MTNLTDKAARPTRKRITWILAAGLLGLTGWLGWYHFLRSPQAEAAPLALAPYGSSVSARAQCAAFSPTGKWLATGGTDKRVRLWDTSTWQEILAVEAKTSTILHIAFAFDTFLAFLTKSERKEGGDWVDSAIQAWSLSDPKQPVLLWEIEGSGHPFWLSPSGDRLVTALGRDVW